MFCRPLRVAPPIKDNIECDCVWVSDVTADGKSHEVKEVYSKAQWIIATIRQTIG
jgi:hypothetical protein